MSQTAKKPQKKSSTGYLPILVIIINLIISWLFFELVCGNPKNFDAKGDPLPNNMLAIVHEGGFVVPFLFAIFLTAVVFTV
ncbi:MAG: MotA/TolQ/ExbB proton channel family protein, partial [Chitinophagales bacterium]|nr:MotA/TolQ/ExbB proton channel family protein [Chitinophagales bacterium]